VQWHHGSCTTDGRCDVVDLPDSGKEGQYVAFSFGERPAHGGCHMIQKCALYCGRAGPERLCATRWWCVANIQWVNGTRNLHDRRTSGRKKPRSAAGLHSCRHSNHKEIFTDRISRVQRESQCQIVVEMAFVDLVEDDCPNSLEFRITLQARNKNARCNKFDVCVGRTRAIATHRESSSIAEPFAQKRGKPARRSACGNTARLCDNDAAAPCAEDLSYQRRDQCGLSGSGRSLNYSRTRVGRVHNRIQKLCHGKVRR
jgi:hypothetical protein